MSKKWLYGVALVALLIAGEAMGITVHEVLSNGFWSAEQRSTLASLSYETRGYYKERFKKEKTTILEDGSEHYSYLRTISCPKSPVASWRYKRWYNKITNKEKTEGTDHSNSKLISSRPMYKEKLEIQEQGQSQLAYLPPYYTAVELQSIQQSVYINKPRKKEARPIGPFVAEDWFPDEMTTTSYLECRFFGTEHNAVTNVISDNEAYITGTISQTGHIDEFDGKKVNQPASLLRTYTQHITTDADHVYVGQEITENTQNDPYYNSQATWQTQYTATFKKGRWKGETETISRVRNQQLSDWVIKRYTQNSR